MPRFFTFSQAQELLPAVKGLIERAVESKSDYERAQGIAQATMSRVSMLGGAWVDRDAFARNDRLKNSSLERLKSAVEQIHGMGVQVKDLDLGLIDFPTLFRGEEVYLCWRIGESEIEYWHGVHEGFGGRKAIDADFLKNHKGREAD